jgi:hypothetical protein
VPDAAHEHEGGGQRRRRGGGRFGQLGGPPGQLAGQARVAPVVGGPAEPLERLGLDGVVAQPPGDLQGGGVVVLGAGIVGELLAQLPPADVGARDRSGVAGLAGGAEGLGEEPLGVAEGEGAYGLLGRGRPRVVGSGPVADGGVVPGRGLGTVAQVRRGPAMMAAADGAGVLSYRTSRMMLPANWKRDPAGSSRPARRARSARRTASPSPTSARSATKSRSKLVPTTAATRRSSSTSRPARTTRSPTASRSDAGSGAPSPAAASRRASATNWAWPPVRS